MALYPKMSWITRKKTLSSSDQLRFLKRLARLLELGYPLIGALDALTMDKHFKLNAIQIKQALIQGQSLDQVLANQQFSPLVTSFIYFAKNGGNLKESIQKGSQLFEQRLKQQKAIRSTSRYPVILLSSFMILFFFIKRFLLPSFTQLFVTSTDPSAGQYALMTINILSYGITGLIVCFLLSFAGWHVLRTQFTISTQLEVINLIPVYRNYIRLQTTFNFATHVSSLLQSGIPIKSVFEIMSAQMQLPILSHYSLIMTKELTKGVQPSEILFNLPFLHDNLATLFQKHADADTLAKDLGVYAEFLTEDIHNKTTRTIAMIQPAIFIVLACFIILTYVTLMAPMLDLIKTI